MTIGYVNPEYNALRAIVGKCPGCTYVRVRSFKGLMTKIAALLGRNLEGRKPLVYYGGIAEGVVHVDLFHFWNNIAIWPCGTPYITTFESSLPRAFPEGRLMEKGIGSLVSGQCRRLIALSESARILQRKFNADHGISDPVDGKTMVLLPPQEILVDENCERPLPKDGVIRVVFCGKDFFRKGGSEIVRALARVRKDFPVEAYLIGDYHHVDYASSWEVDSVEEMERQFDENSSWLHHYDKMPNCELLGLAKQCHIGLLPTRDDTFGYSVLEFQACGLPCITTDIRALPEVNNEKIGWVVSVPKRTDMRADFSSAEKMRELSVIIENGLVEKLRAALSHPELIREKGMLALDSIRKNHSPVDFGMRLGTIYEEALG